MDDEDEVEVERVLPVRMDWFNVVAATGLAASQVTEAVYNYTHTLAMMVIAHDNWRIEQRRFREQVAREIETLPTKE